MPTIDHRRHAPLAADRGGFTLIELLVVVSIIALLAGLLIPIMGVVKDKSMRTRNESLLRIVHAGLLDYAQTYGFPATHATPLIANDLGKRLVTDEASVSQTDRTSAVLTGQISPERLAGDAIVDYYGRQPLIYLSGTPGNTDGRTLVPLPEEGAGTDATDMTATYYEGYAGFFELHSSGPDRTAAATRNDPTNDDNLSVTEPYGDMGNY